MRRWRDGGEYVPFYFAPRSPMLFRIQRGGVDGVSSDAGRLVYVVSSTDAVVEAGHVYVFTDGNAAAAFTEFHDDPDRLDEVVDWPLMKATMWSNTPDDPDRRRRRGAEFVVHQALPFELVHELCVYNADARAVRGCDRRLRCGGRRDERRENDRPDNGADRRHERASTSHGWRAPRWRSHPASTVQLVSQASESSSGSRLRS